jgi:hypothetical protein
MRNKLLGAGLISIRNKEYRLSGQFSKDLIDMARWWCGLQFLINQKKAYDNK